MLGPRDRRLLVTGAAIGGAIAAVVVAAVLLTRTTHSPSVVSAPSSGSQYPKRIVYPTDRIDYGMSERQVLRLVGKPESKQGRCWQYPERPGPRAEATGVTITEVGVCFFSGRVSDESYKSYVRRKGKLVPLPSPSLPVVFPG